MGSPAAAKLGRRFPNGSKLRARRLCERPTSFAMLGTTRLAAAAAARATLSADSTAPRKTDVAPSASYASRKVFGIVMRSFATFGQRELSGSKYALGRSTEMT